MSRGRVKGSVLFAGQSYYHTWYLSRELRKRGWRADVLNWDPNPASDIFYHGEDFRLRYEGRHALNHALFYAKSIKRYDIFHFSNPNGFRLSNTLHARAASAFGPYSEIRLLKRLGKTIVYSNSGCLDGVLQSSFDAWGPEPTCEICPWRNRPEICSDDHNRQWGELRNGLADYQVTTGGNRADFNDDPSVHEVPEFYCLDPDVWHPDLVVPPEHRLPYPDRTAKLFHGVANAETRVDAATRRSLKSTHVWFPLVEKLQREGRDVELVYVTSVSNRDLRYYMLQSDVMCDMLTYGWFGATAREAMMLAKPVIGYLRPSWIEQVRERVPGYVEELPIVNATPETAEQTLLRLLDDPAGRKEIGERSREFVMKWHSAAAAARRFDEIYSELLSL
jgi:hypothetical protein